MERKSRKDGTNKNAFHKNIQPINIDKVDMGIIISSKDSYTKERHISIFYWVCK